MTVIALVHGAYHGSWCWEPLLPELSARGHLAVTVDLPITDPTATVADYANAVLDALAAHDEEVVIVGHSLAGVVLPAVATLRPVRRLIFLAALVPRPGQSARDLLAEYPGLLKLPGDRPVYGERTVAISGDVARDAFYHDCSESVATWAIARLRPQALGVQREPCPSGHWPSFPAGYIVCTDDRALDPALSRAMARSHLAPSSRITEIEGGHSPFLSRPQELAELLDSMI
jgi:pimeloyl-ACP methyl ester carboxylesterase